MTGLIEDVVHALKRELSLLLPHISPAHRVEAMARGLGWPKLNSLLASVKDGCEWRPIDDDAFRAYLSPPRNDTTPKEGVLQKAVDYATSEVWPLHLFENGKAYIAKYGQQAAARLVIPEFLEGPGGVAEFTRPDGPSLLLRQVPFHGTPVLVELWAGPDGIDNNRDFHPTLRRLRALGQSYTWADPDYRSICNELGLAKDYGRPVTGLLSDEDLEGVHQGMRSLLRSGISENGQDLLLWLMDGIKLLTKEKIDFGSFRSLRQEARAYLSGDHGIIHDTGFDPQLATRFATAIMATDKPKVSAYSAIEFLPSANGGGYIASIYGGCDPEQGWFAETGGLVMEGSIVLRPEDMDEDSMFLNFVMKRLVDGGATIVDDYPDEPYQTKVASRSFPDRLKAFFGLST